MLKHILNNLSTGAYSSFFICKHLNILWWPDSTQHSTTNQRLRNRTICSGIGWILPVITFQPNMTLRYLQIKYISVIYNFIYKINIHVYIIEVYKIKLYIQNVPWRNRKNFRILSTGENKVHISICLHTLILLTICLA